MERHLALLRHVNCVATIQMVSGLFKLGSGEAGFGQSPRMIRGIPPPPLPYLFSRELCGGSNGQF